MARILEFALAERGIQSVVVGWPEIALDRLQETPFDLSLVDVHTAAQPLVVRTAALRGYSTVPLLVLMPPSDLQTILRCYEAGADECIIKPVEPLLLLAKVSAWLRRAWTIPVEGLGEIAVGDARLNPTRRQITIGDRPPVKLTNLEFRLLHLLMLRPGNTMHIDVIIQRVWGFSTAGDNALVKNVVYRLRRKIESDPAHPSYLVSVAGEGYCFQP